MVLLGIPPLASGQDLRHYCAFPPLLVDLFRYLPSNLFLFGIMEENGTPVLRTSVGSLLIYCGGIVHPVEELDQLSVSDLGRVEDNLGGLSICISKNSER